jgi:formyltetrahydrofolate deformylase
MPQQNINLTLTCQNRPGIVAAVASYIFEAGGDIQEAQQFDDKDSGRFFMRVSFSCDASVDLEGLRSLALSQSSSAFSCLGSCALPPCSNAF